MYLKFYQLRVKPFHVTPDPEFLFLSPSHKEALASVLYGVDSRKGFIAVTGEVGTGKTTVVRAFLAQRDQSKLKAIYLFNSNLSFEELLRTILTELNADPVDGTVSEMTARLHRVLISSYEAGVNVAVFIDEAQNMPVATLESLRMLSNLETNKEKLLQIVLAGQPELQDKLDRYELRQLNQRIAVRAHLVPLTAAESREYIEYRLTQVAYLPSRVFSEGALKHIVANAKGSPRTLNILCDNVLIAGYASQEKPVSAAAAKRAMADYVARRKPAAKRTWRALPAGLAACAVVALGLALSPIAGLGARLSAAPVPAEMPSALAAADCAMHVADDDVERAGEPAPDKAETPAGAQASLTLTLVDSLGLEAFPVVVEDNPPAAEECIEVASMPPDQPGEAIPGADEMPEPVAAAQPVLFDTLPDRWPVQKGQTLGGIAREVYGTAAPAILAAIRDLNAAVIDEDYILYGYEIALPRIGNTTWSLTPWQRASSVD